MGYFCPNDALSSTQNYRFWTCKWGGIEWDSERGDDVFILRIDVHDMKYRCYSQFTVISCMPEKFCWQIRVVSEFTGDMKQTMGSETIVISLQLSMEEYYDQKKRR